MNEIVTLCNAMRRHKNGASRDLRPALWLVDDAQEFLALWMKYVTQCTVQCVMLSALWHKKQLECEEQWSLFIMISDIMIFACFGIAQMAKCSASLEHFQNTSIQISTGLFHKDWFWLVRIKRSFYLHSFWWVRRNLSYTHTHNYNGTLQKSSLHVYVANFGLFTYRLSGCRMTSHTLNYACRQFNSWV